MTNMAVRAKYFLNLTKRPGKKEPAAELTDDVDSNGGRKTDEKSDTIDQIKGAESGKEPVRTRIRLSVP